MSLYLVSVVLHVLAALLWLGGMFFLAAVGAPALRRVEPSSLRARLFRDLGLRFRTVGWWCIGVLVLTGAANLHFRGVLRADVLAASEFWDSRFGAALAWKLAAVAAMILVSWLHDFVVGPAASRAEAGGERARALRRRASLLARANAVLGVAVVLAAVYLARA